MQCFLENSQALCEDVEMIYLNVQLKLRVNQKRCMKRHTQNNYFKSSSTKVGFEMGFEGGLVGTVMDVSKL